MKWTDEKPTEPGWYWWRTGPGYEPEIGHVFRQEEDGPLVTPYGTDAYGDDRLLLIADAGGQWAGPIPEPED